MDECKACTCGDHFHEQLETQPLATLSLGPLIEADEMLTHNHIPRSFVVVIAKTQQGEGDTPGAPGRDLQSLFDRPFGTPSPVPDSVVHLCSGVCWMFAASAVRNDKRIWRLLF